MTTSDGTPVTTLVWRYASGEALDGVPRTDAGWRRPATRVVHPSGTAYRWHHRPRWQRAAHRLGGTLAVMGELYGQVTHPVATDSLTATAAAAGLVYAGNRARRRWQARRHRRTVVQPLLRALSGPLSLPPLASADRYLTVPVRPDRPGQITRVTLPDHWEGADYQQQQIIRVVRTWIGAPVEAVRWHLTSSPRWVEVTPTPQPPDAVVWRPSADPYVMHLGASPSGPVYVRTETETPHVAVVAGTGSGKTTTLTLPVLHARQHGALVDAIDMKRMSFTERKKEHPNGICGDPDRPSGVVSGVRIHTTIESAIGALAEFIASATAVALMQEQGIDTSHIPARVLVTDEFGSFAKSAMFWWRQVAKMKGASPIPFWMHVGLMQGRALEHRFVIGAHQMERDLFGGTDARDLFGERILTGECSPEKWVTTYGRGVKRPAWDGDIKGRGTHGPLGQRPTLIQIAYVAQQDANAELRALPAAPDWFDAGESAPWLTEEYVREVQSSYGAGRWVPGWSHLFDDDTAPIVEDEDQVDEDGSQDEPRLTIRDAAPILGANYEQLKKAVQRSRSNRSLPATDDGRLTESQWRAWWDSRPRAALRLAKD